MTSFINEPLDRTLHWQSFLPSSIFLVEYQDGKINSIIANRCRQKRREVFFARITYDFFFKREAVLCIQTLTPLHSCHGLEAFKTILLYLG